MQGFKSIILPGGKRKEKKDVLAWIQKAERKT